MPTADYVVMGAMSLPVPTVLEDIETSATHLGFDDTVALLMGGRASDLEYRWTQMQINERGEQREIFCKARLRVAAKSVREISIEMGSIPEIEETLDVLRYQLFYDNKELWLIDRTTHIFRVNGEDRAAFQRSVL
jgi:phage tail tube protein FII